MKQKKKKNGQKRALTNLTDISVLQQFVVFVKYVNSSGKPQTDFLKTQHMTEAATGQELTKCPKNIVQDCQIDLKKMKSCDKDGVGATIGRHSEMAAMIKRDNQISSTSIVCSANLYLLVQMRLRS